MKLLLSLLLSFALGAAANAAGLTFAVDSLDQAKKMVQQERGKHILVFYSSPN
jgi:hypothetical protein